jgi:hypothetical protein
MSLRTGAACTLIVLALAACSHVGLPRPGVLAPSSTRSPASFVASTADAKSTRTIATRDLSKAALFRAAADVLSDKYAVDVSDAHAGFLMTTWQASAIRDGVPDLRYRTRIVVRFVGDEWKQAQVRVEANWQRDDDWDVGYDSALLTEVTDDLRAKIGRR